MELAGLYVDQFPDGDLTQDRVRRHRIKLFPSIEEALTLGRSNLAVDGVVIIAEHGLYPRTEKGQTLYPRHEFFNRTVKVFESSGRAVPVFNDKHLSTDWKECIAMVETSKRLGFPFLAGSSLPVTWRIPAVEVPLNAPLVESVCVGYGGLDSYDIHGIETAQCMSERRAGGLRPGGHILPFHVLEAEWADFYTADGRSFRVEASYIDARPFMQLQLELCGHKGRMRIDLASAAVKPTYTVEFVLGPQNHRSPLAYFYEHLDGFRTSVFLLDGLVTDFNYAGLERGGRVHSCQMYLPMPPAFSTLADFFNPLVNHIEQMILDRAAPYPVERTLLTSGMTLAAIESMYRGGIVLPTPELKVAYSAPAQSCFWRA